MRTKAQDGRIATQQRGEAAEGLHGWWTSKEEFMTWQIRPKETVTSRAQTAVR